jgi:hypothetical protein
MSLITPNRRNRAAFALTAAIAPLPEGHTSATRGAAPTERRPVHTTRRLQPVTAAAQGQFAAGGFIAEADKRPGKAAPSTEATCASLKPARHPARPTCA